MPDKFHSTEPRFISSCKTPKISRHNAMWPQHPNIINELFWVRKFNNKQTQLLLT